MNKIYALVDPVTDAVRYVGKAVDVERRLRRHLKDARDGKRDHKSLWIASLLRQNLRPCVKILEECGDDWQSAEIRWIANLRAGGCDLTNTAPGGEGIVITDETRRRMSEAKKGKTPHNKGKQATAEVKAKLSDAAKRRFDSMTLEQRREYMERANSVSPHEKGYRHTPEARRKISQSLKGNRRTAKLSDADVRAIRSLDLPQAVIAEMFGIKQPKVSSIKNRKLYASVE